ncbi:hypothetical protein COY17_04455 [Candidatus Saccharibacteria bacterium CG_4_10_14_0_2_um_filter_52_9]|nr:MAG: hypothetical protein COY17_04455 [Candidatus Saccharibacteria bacterium CG_4_10_14_0_2_um_filter_52_9]
MKIISHRGARGLAPENTIAGLQKALEHHVDMVEFDLRVTKDGIPVLHHDAELTDPNGERRPIADYTYEELKNHKKDLARFDEVLEAIGRKVPVFIEIKPGVTPKPIINIIKNYYNLLSGQAWIGSFDQEILLAVQKELPEITKVVLEKWSGVRASQRTRQLGTKHIIMNQRWLWWGFIRSMSRHGYKLGAYTVNNPAQAARWQSHGLRAIVTDYPDRFEPN